MKYSTLILFLFIFSFSCKKSNNHHTTNEYSVEVRADIVGQIIDENGEPIIGALVKLNNSTFISDSIGSFQFFDVITSKNNTFIHVTKPNYFNGNRVLQIIPNEDNFTRIMLIKKKNPSTFNANSGGVVQLTGGVKITFEQNSIINKNTGQPYNGQVNVLTTWIDPTQSNFNEILPGALRGYNSSNQERLLESYGMIGAELYDDNNQPLQIANGKTAELTFPIAPSLQSNAPNTIPLWYLDESNGMWIEQGEAQLQGSTYVGKVTHFSFWNADIPTNFVMFETVIVSTNGKPLADVNVKITNISNGTYRVGVTNGNGKVSGYIPKNQNLLMEVIGQCNVLLKSQNITASNSDINIGNTIVSIPASNLVAISGTVFNCFNEPASNAYVKIKTGNTVQFLKVSNNGNFVANYIACDFPIVTDIMSIDNTDMQSGTPKHVELYQGINQVGNLIACGNSYTQYVKWEFLQSGVKKTFVIYDLIGILGGGLSTIDDFPNYNGIYAGDSINNTAISFAFNGPQSIQGSHQLTHYADFLDYKIGTDETNSSIPYIIPVIITKYEQIGGYIEGSFEGLIKGKNIPTRVVKCKFRVQRLK